MSYPHKVELIKMLSLTYRDFNSSLNNMYSVGTVEEKVCRAYHEQQDYMMSRFDP